MQGIRKKIADIKINDIIAAPVLYNGAIVFSKNTTVDEAVLSKLKELGVKKVKVALPENKNESVEPQSDSNNKSEINKEKLTGIQKTLKNNYLNLTNDSNSREIIYIIRQLSQEKHPEFLDLIKLGFEKFYDPDVKIELLKQCSRIKIDEEAYNIIYNYIFSVAKQVALTAIEISLEAPDKNKSTLYICKLLATAQDPEIINKIKNLYKEIKPRDLNKIIKTFDGVDFNDKNIQKGFDILKKLLNYRGQKNQTTGKKAKIDIPKFCTEPKCNVKTFYTPTQIDVSDIKEARSLFKKNYKEANEHVEKIYEEISKSKEPDVSKIKNIASGFIDQIFYNRNMVARLRNVFTGDNYLYSHSLNVCILSVLTGFFMDYDSNKIAELGMAAMMADVGMMNVKDKVWEKPKILNDEERELIRMHIFEGFDLLNLNDDLKDIIATVALQHHERMDGSGYLNFKGENLVEYSRIVAICDVYDALTSDRVYRKKFSVQSALRYLISNTPQKFDSNAMKAFIKHVGFMPIGTKVLLNNGKKAYISGTNRDHWSKPRIFIEDDKENEVDLMLEKDLFIKEVLEEDVLEFEQWHKI
ncbi:MAG: HD-GYP domain-containing protein [Candidatus Muiribacteriota bacterium]